MEDMNCIWLNKQNPYDILCKIQDYMGRTRCILEALEGHDILCNGQPCHKCIEKWMIERRTK